MRRSGPDMGAAFLFEADECKAANTLNKEAMPQTMLKTIKKRPGGRFFIRYLEETEGFEPSMEF